VNPSGEPTHPLPRYRRVLAVCAHPDDETFGLGAVISALVDDGARVELLCLTAGEASTLGAGQDLGPRRSRELGCAARLLGIERVVLGDHPDGGLEAVPLPTLTDEVARVAGDADALLVFDDGGITGHPDHQRATDAAIEAARRLDIPVLAWALPQRVAAQLDEELGVPFVGRTDDELAHVLEVDRTRQLAAMSCHGSQLADNPVPRRRIQLQGPVEHLRIVHDPARPRGQ
jgi:N-acetylglucosamine malate deacetylase 2